MDISISSQNNTGLIYLQRPKALNALTMEMCSAIETALRGWEHDKQIKQVILYADGERSFCAGGDVAALYHLGKAGKIDQINAFWREEYRMNSYIAHYPKPIIAMMQGYVMGGGVGIGCHASHRIICETTKLAMPECAIGLIPDVGGSYLLARTDGHIGEYMALTGARISPSDILATGFADYHIEANNWELLRAEIINNNTLSIIDELASQPKDPSEIDPIKDEIDAIFGQEDIHQFCAALTAEDTDFKTSVKKAMSRSSPLSMASIFTLIREVRIADNIDDALDWEYRFTSRAIEQADFLEGVRAVLVDKDHAPNWLHSQIDEVPAELIAQLFAPASRR